MRKAGALVWVIGYPFDLLVLHNGCWFVLEVKTATGRLNKAQRQLAQALEAHGYSLPVVHTPQQALEAIQSSTRVLLAE